jgi:alpha-galactosidase
VRRTICLALTLLSVGATAGCLAPAADASAGHAPRAAGGAQAGLAATPPLGWNDWYAFYCNVDEQLVTQTADAMVASGMKDAGYRYVNLDDCWASHSRDANGDLQADPQKFPHGMPWLADYVHARGLKLGIYEDVGTETCAGYPGSYGHARQDARRFASWRIDFVKVDWCNVPFGEFPGLSHQDVAKRLYGEYSQAIRDSGRPMLFSICEWDPSLEPWTWAPAISEMWRTNNDYGNSWSAILHNLDGEAGLARYAGPGHWNDPDILQVGLPGGLTDTEDQAHFSLWSLLAAPLQAGNDLRSMSARTRQILTNREVLAVDQDRLGAQGDRVARDGDADVWARPLAGGDRAVVLLNRGTDDLSIATSAARLGLRKAPDYAVRDLWGHTTRQTAGRIRATLAPHSAAMYRVSPLRRVDPTVAPATSVTPPAAPPISPGYDRPIVQPGETTAITARFENDGAAAVHDVRLALTAPDGWTVRPERVRTGAVGRNRTFTARWAVTPPAGEEGDHVLSVDAHYRRAAGGGSGSTSSQRSVTVQRLSAPTGSTYLSDLQPLDSRSDFSYIHADRTYYGGPLTIHGQAYPKGLWANANASADYYLGGACSRLTADLGLDDSDRSAGSVVYRLYADGDEVYDSGVVTNATPTLHVDQDVSGTRVLRLVITDAGDGIDYDNADLGGGALTCAS